MKHLLTALLLLCAGLPVCGQPQLRKSVAEATADGRLSFELYAPTAKNVSVTGTFDGFTGGAIRLLPDSTTGRWAAQTATAVPSDFYTFTFLVDGCEAVAPELPSVLMDGGRTANCLCVPGSDGDLYGVQDVPHGRVEKVWYGSDALGTRRRMTVYLPAAYDDLSARGERLPVLYLLHGMTGNEESWESQGCAVNILDGMIATGRCRPMIVCMPNGHTCDVAHPAYAPAGQNRTSADQRTLFLGLQDGTMETSFGEIIAYVEAHYAAMPDKSHRAIAGLSMGGFHTLHIAASMPDAFDFVALFSPVAPFSWGTPTADGQMDEAVLAQMPAVHREVYANLERERAAGFRYYGIYIGSDDFLYKGVARHREKLTQMAFPFEYHESSGAHTWTNWRHYLQDFLPRLF